MERRVAGIIRWLERCVKAYKDGSVESALMDAECARADMENLRGDLWGKLEGRARAGKRGAGFLRAAEALCCALAIMLLMAAPLAVPQTDYEKTEDALTMEWLTPDELELLTNVRKRPEDSPAMAAATAEAADAAPVSAQAPVSARKPAARPAEPAKRESPEPEEPRRKADVLDKLGKPGKQAASLTYDSILSLIETGERAMKVEPPVIRVETLN